MGKEIGKQRMGFREWVWRKGHDLKKNNLDHTEGSKHALLHSRFKFSPVQSGLLVFYATSKMFPSLRLYANSRKYACSEYSASLQLNWFHKNILVNSPSFSFLTPRCWLVLLALLLLLLPPCPLFPLFYQVLYGSGYSFSVCRESCQYSPHLLWKLLHL